MLSFLDIMPMWEKMGVKRHVIYAPESDYKNLDFENALKGDYELMKTETLSPLAKKFQSDVRKYRSGKVDITQKGILNGRMFYAKDAIKYGLADEIGNLDYAVKRAGQLADKR
jgi:protease-4